MIKNTNILIKSDTKDRLKKMKGKNSHDSFITSMMNYFDRNEITPFEDGVLNSVQIDKNTDRIIKILRAYERDYLKPTQFYSEKSVLLLSNNDKEIGVKEGENNEEKDNTVIKKLEKKIEILQSKLDAQKIENSTNDLDIKIENVLNQINELHDQFKSSSGFNSQKLEINKIYLDTSISNIKKSIIDFKS